MSPSEAMVRGEHRLGRRVINKAADELAASFLVDLVTNRIADAGWPELKPRIISAHVPHADFWAEIDLPEIPNA
jgi:hypothetical protein